MDLVLLLGTCYLRFRPRMAEGFILLPSNQVGVEAA